MINLRESSGKLTTYVKEFVVDETAEIEDLPVQPVCAIGSVAYCIEDGKLYILNGENEWVEA